MNIVIIHHSADFDGLFCREIARRYFGDKATYLGWDYGDPVPVIEPGTQLYMLDISIDGLMDWPGLTWIDHHKSAIEKYGRKEGLQLDGVAACRLAWRWFYHPAAVEATTLADYRGRTVEEPHAVTLAGEYDIWDKRDPDAELFQHGLRSCEVDWALLLSNDRAWANEYVAKLLKGGTVLQFARNNENKSVITRQGFTLQFEGLMFLACNAARFNSLLFTAGLQPEHDGCLGFCWDGGKGKWKVSLYGRPGKPDIDFSAIATRYGGGGHKQACGFECLALPFKLTDLAPLQATDVPWNEETSWILGQPCFTVAHIAQTLRLMGLEIPTKAEAEQAAVLHWEINLWLKHGACWRGEAQKLALAAIDAAKTKGGGA